MKVTYLARTTVNVPDSFKVGKAVIECKGNSNEFPTVEYQSWLNNVVPHKDTPWGNVNVDVDLTNLQYIAYLDYGSSQMDDGKTVAYAGQFSKLTSAAMTKELGSKIFRDYPYKETIDGLR